MLGRPNASASAICWQSDFHVMQGIAGEEPRSKGADHFIAVEFGIVGVFLILLIAEIHLTTSSLPSVDQVVE